MLLDSYRIQDNNWDADRPAPASRRTSVRLEEARPDRKRPRPAEADSTEDDSPPEKIAAV